MNEWGAGNAKKWLHCLMKHPCRHHSRILLWTPAPLLTDNQIKKRQCGSDKNSGQDHVASFVLLVRCCALYASASDCWTSIAGSSPVPSSPIQSHPVQPGHRYRTIIPDLLYYATVYTRLLVQVLLGPVKVVHIQWVVSCSLSYTV